jgi:hypothetical protein
VGQPAGRANSAAETNTKIDFCSSFSVRDKEPDVVFWRENNTITKNDEFEAQERVSLVGCRKICNPGIKKKKKFFIKALLPQQLPAKKIGWLSLVPLP